jgi:hypothetical protein
MTVDSEWQRLVYSIFLGGGAYGIFFLLLPFEQLKFLRIMAGFSEQRKRLGQAFIPERYMPCVTRGYWR